MKYGKVLTYKDVEEAKKLIGKKVVCSDNLYVITETPETRCVSVLKSINCTVSAPFETSAGYYQFIREVIEEEPQLMTNRQLGEWCGKGNGLFKTCSYSCSAYRVAISCEDDPVPDGIFIRPWDSEEWVVPTVDIYERDCKRGN